MDNKNIKKRIVLTWITCFLFAVLTGCGNSRIEEGTISPAAEKTQTEDISPEGLMKVYQALGKEAAGERVAVKISTGETGSNYLRPELIGDFIDSVNGTIVECNTAYGGDRSSTAYHRQLAENPFRRFVNNLSRNLRATGGYFFVGVLLSALFQRYVPADIRADIFGGNGGFGVLMAATIGVPLYAYVCYVLCFFKRYISKSICDLLTLQGGYI